MRFSAAVLLCTVLVPPAVSPAQKAATPAKTSAGAPKTLPPFAGTWIMDQKRSTMLTPIRGESKAIISYDGKTWKYVHSHQESPDDEPDQWQQTLVVNSPTYNTTQGVGITFHARIMRQGDSMVLQEHGETLRGQKTRNTVKYTLEDNGNTLIENETSVGPLGPQHNKYVLVREFSTPQATAPSGQ